MGMKKNGNKNDICTKQMRFVCLKKNSLAEKTLETKPQLQKYTVIARIWNCVTFWLPPFRKDTKNIMLMEKKPKGMWRL